MHKLNKWIKFPLYFIFGIGILTGVLFIYLYIVAIDHPPTPADLSVMEKQITKIDSTFYVSGNNWIRKSNSGLWEMYVEGNAFERGVMNGKLSRELVHEQESAFSEQINKLVPSAFYRNFLKYFIAWFNRDLDEQIPEEYKLEIYGVSRSASSEFDYIGSAYQRMMNYHAAHDIGHALQNLALVGCSSFGTWDSKSENNNLIIGRNFDFYVGDRFAKDKIVLFMRPDKGYPFMMVTWGGMTGVVSGMNMEGLTVTLNAAKSSIPSAAATPVSLLAREILQYAKNIDEAIAIAATRKTFVSESFLIGSSHDKKAISIEVTPDTLAVYDPNKNFIICTNHYESELLGNSKINIDHKLESASVYRSRRIGELLDTVTQNTAATTASILRNQLGLKNKFIGYGNEKAINQLICHHSIIFEPEQKIVWVSTQPWQLGSYVAYRLDVIFSLNGLSTNRELTDSTLTIPADSFIDTQNFSNFIEFRKMKEAIANKNDIDLNKFISLNPEYYHTYVLAGDYLFGKHKYAEALQIFEMGLTKEIASESEKKYIIHRIAECNKKLK